MTFYKHIDGGVYRWKQYARSAATGKDVVLYEHLWPVTTAKAVRRAKRDQK